MPTLLESVRFCRCFESNQIDLIRRLPDPCGEAATRRFAPESEQFLPLHPEADCLQRWLDLNA